MKEVTVYTLFGHCLKTIKMNFDLHISISHGFTIVTFKVGRSSLLEVHRTHLPIILYCIYHHYHFEAFT